MFSGKWIFGNYAFVLHTFLFFFLGVGRYKGRYGLLREVNVTRQKFLTPKAKHLYKKVIEKSNRLAKLSTKLKSFQGRIRAAENLANSLKFERLLDHVNPLTYNFILSQVRTQKQHPKARRYTLQEKILALTILKASGRGYRLLSKMFTLPSKKTLTELLRQLPFPCGVNKGLFESLQEPVQKMQPHDRIAILVFDEMSIDSILQYNSGENQIEGLHDLGDNGRKPEIADYANVFMLKGIFKQWKQPVCYSFNAGPTRSHAIKQLIVDIIKECQKIQLEIIATICDQGSGNQAAINILLQETQQIFLQRNEENRNFGFIVNNQEIIPLYDTPHLFKGLRNNLLTKDLHFEINQKKCVAKWKHFEQFYSIDSENPNEKVCPKLTDQHIIPEKINKMKVKCCTQVFSHQVGSLMKKILMWSEYLIYFIFCKYIFIHIFLEAQVDLDPGAMDTAELSLFLDKLFDSVNSSHRSAPPGKPLKGGVTSTSSHIEFWYESIKIIKTMKYFCHKNKKFVSVPSLNNCIKTLKGFIYLSKKILDRYPKKYIVLRVFQQDALENFFGCIRNYSGREINPSASHFVSSFKALIINNFMSVHSPGSNCEQDESIGLLGNLKNFFLQQSFQNRECMPLLDVEIPSAVVAFKKSKISRCTQVYIAGYITKKLFEKIKCGSCKQKLLYRDHDEDTDFITARQYKHSNLIKPGTVLSFLISQSTARLFYVIPRLCHIKQISLLLQKILLEQQPNFKLINQSCHLNNDITLVKIVIRCCLFFWCKQVNRIIKGKDSKFIKFIQMKPDAALIDPVKMQAYKKLQKKNKRTQK